MGMIKANLIWAINFCIAAVHVIMFGETVQYRTGSSEGVKVGLRNESNRIWQYSSHCGSVTWITNCYCSTSSGMLATKFYRRFYEVPFTELNAQRPSLLVTDLI